MSLYKTLVYVFILMGCQSLYGSTVNSDSFQEIKIQINEVYDTNIINSNFNFYLKYRLSEPLKSLEKLDSALVIAIQLGDKEKAGWLLYHKGYLYRQMGIYNLAALSYLESMEIYEKLENKNFYGWILIELGNLHMEEKQDLNKSLHHFTKAQQVFLKIDSKVGIIVSKYCIGKNYLAQNQYDNAISFFEAAIILSRQVKEQGHEVIAMSFIGEVYLKKNSLSKALEVFNETLKISRSANNFSGISRSYSKLADVYEHFGNLPESMAYHKKALLIYRSIPDKINIANTLNKIGKLYEARGDLPNAIDFSRQALSIADSNNFLSLQDLILPLLVQYYSKQNNVDEAFHYLKKHTNLKEFNISKTSRQIQHEYELHLLKKEKLLSEEVVKRQKIIILVSIVSLIVFTVLVVVIYRKNKRLKESYRHLYNNHLQLTQKEEELETLKRQNRYEGSSLKDRQQITLLNSLNQLLSDKIYLKKDITLDIVAELLKTNRTYLSQVINDQYGLNFNNFINEYRIKEAQRQLLDPSIKMLTIEAIAREAGFNSKSSFNIAFKKVTGLTPTDFIKINDNKL